MKKTIGSAILLAAACQPALAMAQSSSPEQKGLDEIIVTAQKREENLQSTPLSISAVTSETLEARGIIGIDSLTGVAPNLIASSPAGGPNNVALFIRSIGLQDPILTQDSPVALYVDGINIARESGSAFEIADLERIEVLRGPQGTLYGRNTIGGAVNLITRKPGDEFAVRQKLGIGSYDFFTTRTIVDIGELADSGLRASLTYLHSQRDGYVDDLNANDSHDPGAYRTNGARVALSFDRDTGVRAYYTFDYNHSKGLASANQMTAARPDLVAFFAGSAAAGGAPFVIAPKRAKTVALDNHDYTVDKVRGHGLTLEIDLSDSLTLKSLTGYRKWDQVAGGIEFDGQGFLFGPILGMGPTPRSLRLFAANGDRHQNQWSQEINLIGNIGDALDFVVGGYYFKEKVSEHNPQYLSIILPFGAIPITSILDYRHESSTKAVFAQGTAHLTDQVNLTVGGRYTSDFRSIAQTAPAPRTLSDRFNKFNWAATLDYQFNDDVMVYGRIATGYKAGGYNARSFDVGFEPENMTSYEMGLKSELLDNRLRFNATAFYSDRSDMQVTSFMASPSGAVSITANAAKAIYKGIEIEVNAVPVDGLTAYATVGYTDRDYKKYVVFDTATSTNVDISSIAKFSYAASTTVNAGIQYEFPAFSFGKLSARLDYNYMSKIFFESNPALSPFRDQVAAPRRGLFDARLALSDIAIGRADATLSLWGRNIFDKKYRTTGTDFGSLGYALNTYGPPAMWGVDLSLNF